MSFVYQLEEKLFRHYICIHEDVSVLCISAVRLNRKYTFLFVDIQCIAGKERIFRIVNRVIHHGDVCAGVNMCLNKITVISGIDHVARCNDNIRLRHSLDAVHVLDVSLDICAVDIAYLRRLCIHDAQFTAF